MPGLSEVRETCVWGRIAIMIDYLGEADMRRRCESRSYSCVTHQRLDRRFLSTQIAAEHTSSSPGCLHRRGGVAIGLVRRLQERLPNTHLA